MFFGLFNGAYTNFRAVVLKVDTSQWEQQGQYRESPLYAYCLKEKSKALILLKADGPKY